MNKAKTDSFFLVNAKGVIKDYGNDILEAISVLKKTPAGAVIRSDGIIMAGDAKATAAAEKKGKTPWGKTRKAKDSDPPPPKREEPRSRRALN